MASRHAERHDIEFDRTLDDPDTWWSYCSCGWKAKSRNRYSAQEANLNHLRANFLKGLRLYRKGVTNG